MIIERLVRTLADLNRQHRASASGRRLVRHVIERARREALSTGEAARADERLDLARRIFMWAAAFVLAREGLWAFQHWHRWRVAWDLDVDSSGRLWRAEEVHCFGRVPARLIVAPEDLASLYPTRKLRDAVAATEGNFWFQALSKELASLLLPRGRPI
jgi:hypothetical protein